jgi:hypothetical protein
MLPLLRPLLPLVNIAALVFVMTRRRLLGALRARSADAPERAIPLERSGLSTWWLKRLTAEGVFRRTPAGLYWLDREAYRRYRRVRIIRVAVVLVLAAVAWVWFTTACCAP